MRRLRGAVFGVFVALGLMLASLSASAVTYTYTATKGYSPDGIATVYSSMTDMFAGVQSKYTWHGCADLGNMYMRCYDVSNGSHTIGYGYAYLCPSGGTLSGTSCINAPACPSGQLPNSSNVCAPVVCPSAGTAMGTQCVYTNVTIVSGSTTCANGQCSAGYVWNLTSWPTGGFGPTGCGFNFTSTGPNGTSTYVPSGTYNTGDSFKAKTCGNATSNGQVQSFNGAPTCPDGTTYGQVNGVDVCVPSTGSSAPAPMNPGTNSNPVVGSSTPISGQSSSFAPDPTSGSSPYAGPNGGAQSGIPGVNASGATETCGWPGYPPCKIDETGTPQDASLKDAKNAFDAANKDRVGLFNDTKWQISTLKFSWSPVLGSGTCQAVTVYNKAGSLDICQPLGMVRDFWSWIIYILTAYTILAIGFNAVSGGSK